MNILSDCKAFARSGLLTQRKSLNILAFFRLFSRVTGKQNSCLAFFEIIFFIFLKNKNCYFFRLPWVVELSEILSSFHRNFLGGSATRIFPLIDGKIEKHPFFPLVIGGKIYINWIKLSKKLRISESNHLN